MTPFEHWWYHEGSQPPTAGHDLEEHCKRMCKIAWDNGAFEEREACAKLCEKTPPWPFRPSIEAAHAIRARSQP